MRKTKVFRTRADFLFYIVLLALPVVQFCIFYLAVNFNSILMAFQKYVFNEDGTSNYVFSGLHNFAEIFSEEKLAMLLLLSKNSLILLFCNIIIGIPFALMFSFYIYKKKALSELFKVFLYLPQIISIAVIGLIYMFFVDQALPEILTTYFKIKVLPPFRQNIFAFSLFFTVFFGFGTSVLLYVGAMGKVSDSSIEAASIDGASSFQEFFYVVLPQIFPTIYTFVITGLAGLFLNQMNLYTFLGSDVSPDAQTMGYYLYITAKSQDQLIYPYLSALGLLLTVITTVIVNAVKYVMNKLDPMGA